jgi:hypothetical protein
MSFITFGSLSFTIDRSSTKTTLIPFSQSPAAQTALQDVFQKRGFNPKKLPTKSETKGYKFVSKSRDTDDDTPTITEVASESWGALVSNEIAPTMGGPLTSQRLTGAAYKNRSLTYSLMSKLPKFNFKDGFRYTNPTDAVQQFCVSWGYGLSRIPSSGLGPGYTDKFPVRLWLPKSGMDTVLPTGKTGYSYLTASAVSAQGNNPIEGNADSRDMRGLEARFDQLKNLPAVFSRAAELKVLQGDNHIAFLTIARLRLLSLKQALECGVTSTISMNNDSANKISLALDPDTKSRNSVFAKTADVLADCWFGTGPQSQGNWVPEMLLPSANAREEEVIYLAYLAGMLDSQTTFTLGGVDTKSKPYFMGITSTCSQKYKIPLGNELRILSLNEIAKTTLILELGRAEAVMNDYVKRYGLEQQMTTCDEILIACCLDWGEKGSKGILKMLPTPNHCEEFTLWATNKSHRALDIPLLTLHESANLLAGMVQIYEGMMIDVIGFKLFENLHGEGLCYTDVSAGPVTLKYLDKLFPSGMQDLFTNMCQNFLGRVSPETPQCVSARVDALARIAVDNYNNGQLRVSSLLNWGITDSNTSLKILWDDKYRSEHATRLFTTLKNSVALDYLYNSDADIMSTGSLNWLDFIGDDVDRRSERKNTYPTGVRNLNNVKGKPKIIHVGLELETTEYRKATGDSGTATNRNAHYEPTFDHQHQQSYSQVAGKLHHVPQDGHDHSHVINHEGRAPVKGARARRGSVTEDIKDTLVALGRIGFNKLMKGKPTLPPSDPKPFGIDFINATTTGHVTGLVTNNNLNASTNGLREAHMKMKGDNDARLAKALSDQMESFPYKNSELMEISDDAATANMHQAYYATSDTVSIATTTVKVMDALLTKFNILETDRDGRCGASSIQIGLSSSGSTLSKKDVYSREAELMGLVVEKNRAPAHYWLDDLGIAALAFSYSKDLVILDRSNETRSSVRIYRCSHSSGTLTVLACPSHFKALTTKFANSKFDDLDADDFINLGEKLLQSGQPSPELPRAALERRGGDANDRPASPLRRKPRGVVMPTVQKRISDQEFEEIMEECRAYNRIHRTQETDLVIEGNFPEGLDEEMVNKKQDLLQRQNYSSELSALGHFAVAKLPVSEMRRRFKANLSTVGYSLDIREYALNKSLPEETRCPKPMAVRDVVNLTCNRYDDPNNPTMKGLIASYMKLEGRMDNEALRVYAGIPAAAVDLELAIKCSGRPATLIHVDDNSRTEPNMVSCKVINPGCKNWGTMPMMVWIERKSQIYLAARDVVGINGIETIFLADSPHNSQNNLSVLSNDDTKRKWHMALDIEFNKLGVLKEDKKVSCSERDVDTLFGEHDIVSAANKMADNNLERLAACMMMQGRIKDAVWVRNHGLSWLTQLTRMPVELSWIDRRACILLAVSCGFVFWDLDFSDNLHVTQWQLKHSKSTIPVAMSGDHDRMKFHTTNAHVKAFESLQEFSNYCDKHRDNKGNIPKVPIEGPQMPNIPMNFSTKFKRVAPWVLLGLVGSGTLLFGVYTIYRKRTQLTSVITTLRDYCFTRGDDAERESLLQNDAERVEIEDYIERYDTRYYNERGTGTVDRNISPHAGSAHTLDTLNTIRTIDIGAAQPSSITTSYTGWITSLVQRLFISEGVVHDDL